MVFSYVGFETKEIKVKKAGEINVTLSPGSALEEVVVTGYSERNDAIRKSMGYGVVRNNASYPSIKRQKNKEAKLMIRGAASIYGSRRYENNNRVSDNESYGRIEENIFKCFYCATLHLFHRCGQGWLQQHPPNAEQRAGSARGCRED